MKEEPEKCEGCGDPATTHDSEGVPLCKLCAELPDGGEAPMTNNLTTEPALSSQSEPGAAVSGSVAVPITCEACGMTGEVESPKHMESVSCPDCNARYLYWPEGQKYGGKSQWKCVVRPIFRQPPQNGDISGGRREKN